MIKKLTRSSLLAVLFTLPICVFCQDYRSTIDYIQKTNKLWGVSACIVNADKSVTFVDAKNKGYGFGLWMSDGKNGGLDKITLKSGQFCQLRDKHHVFITYKFTGIKAGRVIVEVTDEFDARSFGKGVKVEKKKLTILPYNDA